MKTEKRIFAAAAALLLAAALVCSPFVFALIADHDCAGEGCRLCLVQIACENALKLAGIAACAFLAYSVLLVLLGKNRTGITVFAAVSTPVALKIKLLN